MLSLCVFLVMKLVNYLPDQTTPRIINIRPDKYQSFNSSISASKYRILFSRCVLPLYTTAYYSAAVYYASKWVSTSIIKTTARFQFQPAIVRPTWLETAPLSTLFVELPKLADEYSLVALCIIHHIDCFYVVIRFRCNVSYSMLLIRMYHLVPFSTLCINSLIIFIRFLHWQLTKIYKLDLS